jgi:hypothetical protein
MKERAIQFLKVQLKDAAKLRNVLELDATAEGITWSTIKNLTDEDIVIPHPTIADGD